MHQCRVLMPQRRVKSTEVGITAANLGRWAFGHVRPNHQYAIHLQIVYNSVVHTIGEAPNIAKYWIVEIQRHHTCCDLRVSNLTTKTTHFTYFFVSLIVIHLIVLILIPTFYLYLLFNLQYWLFLAPICIFVAIFSTRCYAQARPMHRHGLCCPVLSVHFSLCVPITFVCSVETSIYILKLFHYQVATPFVFFPHKPYSNIPTGTPLTRASYAGCIKILQFSKNISLYLRNEAR